MTNKDFYAFCRDQRHVESDPGRRTALTRIYHYLRECGATKQGIANYLDHCEQECARDGSDPAGYQWLRRVFAGVGPEVKAEGSRK